MIHPTAIIHDGAKIGTDCEIGPNCIVSAGAVLGDRVRLISNVIIENHTEIGDDTIVYPFAVLGSKGQDLKYQDDADMSGVKIGKRCKIREFATINQGTPASAGGTVIGDDCQIMIHAHVGHDAHVGNNVIMSNSSMAGGHVELEDFVIISANSAVHQFCRVGRNAFLGAFSATSTDMMPYAIYDGTPAKYRTINKVGLVRHGFTNEDLHAVHTVYAGMRDDKYGDNMTDRLKKIRREVGGNKYALDALDFIENRSTRGVANNA
ncbi:MAG: acyl-ACP--UDP-N-acetylglucosamine O-acyltransferase [Rickettsiales bacterium]|jgi:UDP-N-acetylglucosamine acyltransferase|nr:acyl-ACP--UDP-N-acetylglucosamine O-acyltransferase [Rickettsiales bacterium]